MRIIAGAYKARTLIAPPGATTRPTSDRARQALFDMILHAPWGGSILIENATILDAFAGTGALGLEALSRGAGFAHFIENDPAALTALRANIAAVKTSNARVHASSALAPPPGPPCRLIFLDPPYGKSLIPQAAAKLAATGWIAKDTIIIAETASAEPAPTGEPLLADRNHGAARIWVWCASTSI